MFSLRAQLRTLRRVTQTVKASSVTGSGLVGAVAACRHPNSSRPPRPPDARELQLKSSLASPFMLFKRNVIFQRNCSLSLPSACFMGILHACLILIWIHGCLFFLRSLSITDTAWRCSRQKEKCPGCLG